MRRLSSLAWRSLLARPLRSTLTVIGIGLGVAVLFAALSVGAAMDAAVDGAAADELGHASLRVAALQERGLTSASVQIVEQTPGVLVAAPALERRTYLASTDADKPGAALPAPVTVLGIDPERDARLHDLPLTPDSVRLTQGLERSAIVSQTLATAERVAVGDTIGLNGAAATGPQEYRIVGIVAGDGPLATAHGRLVILPLSAATELFAASGVTRIDVGVRDGASVDEVVGQLEARLTVEPYLLERRADVAAALRSSTEDFRGTLLLVAALVLFAGAFLIFNTLSMTVSERSREVGLLRAAGATRSQVRDFVLLQAAALGLAGAAAGIAGGLALAAIATMWLRDTGSVAVQTPAITPATVLLSGAIGLLVTLAAALEPAWRAGRIPPVEALRRGGGAGGGTAARLRWLVLVFAFVAFSALLIWPRGDSPASDTTPFALSGLWGPLAVYGLMLLAVLLLPLILRPLLRLAGLPLLLFRNEERLARSSLARDRSRTALTAGALVVALAMVVALGTAAQNVRHVAAAWLAETIPGSELVTSVRPVATDDPGEADLRLVPGVTRVSPIALFGAPLGGVRQDAAAVVGADLLADGRLTFVEGDRGAALTALDGGGSVVLPLSVARRLGVHVNDTLEFATGPSPTRMRIAGVAAHTIPGASGETVLVGWNDASGPFGVLGADFLAVRFDPAVAGAQEALDTLARSYAFEPADLDALRGGAGGVLERIFALLDLLALAAVLVAGLGVANTLWMNVRERVREIGVLRATGMTSRQVWRMVVVEAAVLGVAGAILGSAVGVVLGLLLAGGSGAGFALTLEPPWQSVALAAGLGVVVSVLAAIYPARLASRLSIVRAVQYE